MTLPLYVSCNGTLILPEEARVSVFNPALFGAYGAYESLQVGNGVAFELTAHLRRLAYSAQLIGLPLPADLTTLAAWCEDALAANHATACTLRLFVIGAEQEEMTTAYIWPQAAPVYPPTYYTHGADAITYAGVRYLPQAKSLNTLASFLAQRQARAAGVHEGLLYHDGRLTEGSNSNLFAVIGDEVLTPPAAEVLSGVTRDLVIALAAQHDIPLREASLALAELPRWQECFITSTSRHVMPITRIDGRPVGDGTVGPFTRRLAALFEAYFTEQTREK